MELLFSLYLINTKMWFGMLYSVSFSSFPKPKIDMSLERSLQTFQFNFAVLSFLLDDDSNQNVFLSKSINLFVSWNSRILNSRLKAREQVTDFIPATEIKIY